MPHRTRSHRDLAAWRTSMDLLAECYALARILPKHELYGLGAQLRRASLSVPANIAEGNARVHRGDYVRHLSIARGSLMEVSTLLDAAELLGYTTAPALDRCRSLIEDVARPLYGLISALRPPGESSPR